jgi:hypothetical protein
MVVSWTKPARGRWELVDEHEHVLRTVMAREPGFKVSKRYVVFGESWGPTIHDSLEAAQVAAEESLPGTTQIAGSPDEPRRYVEPPWI